MQIEDISKEKNKTLKEKTIIAIGWTTTAQIGRQILSFLISVILARTLSPKEFGLIGMITVFTGFAALFSTLGFTGALVQKKKIEERHYSSIFWLNLFIGIVLTLIIIGISPYISEFYQEPKLRLPTMLIATTFIINSFNLIQRTIMYRELNFRILAIIEIVSLLFGGIVAIILAAFGYGVWSLAWEPIIIAVVSVVIMWIKSPWRPQLIFDKGAIKELFGFSANMLGDNITNYLTRNSDNMLVGKFMGSSTLGIYSRAYGLMYLPVRQVNYVLSRVMFPALCTVQDDKLRVKRIYLKSISLIALITFPMMIGLFIVSEHFIFGVYGAKWAGVIPILKIFCLVGLIQSISFTVDWIYTSQGRADWKFRWGIVSGILLIGSIIVGIWIGNLKAVAICYGIMSGVILTYPEFSIPGRLINMTFSNVIRSVAGIFLSALFMGICMLGLEALLPDKWSHWLYLSVLIPFGILVYFVMVHFLKIEAYLEFKNIIIEQIRVKSAKLRAK